jgi:hypothetical protein
MGPVAPKYSLAYALRVRQEIEPLHCSEAGGTQ